MEECVVEEPHRIFIPVTDINEGFIEEDDVLSDSLSDDEVLCPLKTHFAFSNCVLSFPSNKMKYEIILGC